MAVTRSTALPRPYVRAGPEIDGVPGMLEEIQSISALQRQTPCHLPQSLFR